MANAKHDENHVPTLTATLNTDGATIVPIKVSSANKLKISDAMTGSDNGPANAPHDQNHVPALIAISSVDGITPVVVYADVNGNLLVDSQ